MKRKIQFGLICLLSTSVVVFAAEPSAVSNDIIAQHNIKIEKRVNEANILFSEKVSQAPLETIKVVAHFRNSNTAKQIVDIVGRYNLTVTGFRHGNSKYSGGYTLKPNETVQEAIRQYLSDHDLFMKRDYKLTKKYLSETTGNEDPQLAVALNSRLSDIQQRQLESSLNGLQIVGLELLGSALALNEFRKDNNFVRVMEISKKGIPQPSIIIR